MEFIEKTPTDKNLQAKLDFLKNKATEKVKKKTKRLLRQKRQRVVLMRYI